MTANQSISTNEEQPKPWHAAYPAPRNAASWVTRQTLLSWMKKGKVAGGDFVLVDLRRTDFEVDSPHLDI
jgi:arsenical-resistance protein 2